MTYQSDTPKEDAKHSRRSLEDYYSDLIEEKRLKIRQLYLEIDDLEAELREWQEKIRGREQ